MKVSRMDCGPLKFGQVCQPFSENENLTEQYTAKLGKTKGIEEMQHSSQKEE